MPTTNPVDALFESDLESDPFVTLAMDDTSHYIGLMSGTSLDALDAVLCRFVDDSAELIATHSQSFDDSLRGALLALCTPNGVAELDMRDVDCAALGLGSDQTYSELDFFGLISLRYGELASAVVLELLDKAGMDAQSVVAIGCHGQTVRHRPELGFSLQLIDPNVLAERTGISVVSDFRRRDMAVGGQGAPLVPAFHQAVFGKVQSTKGEHASDAQRTVILNLGGIANITVLGTDKKGDETSGYDTGVANLLMDAWIMRHHGRSYDAQGDWARAGAVNFALLDRLMGHPFLALCAPKSTGREDFDMKWLDGILADFVDTAPVDVQATLCEFTALTASREIDKFAKHQNLLYVCGGGAYNTHLMNRLATLLPNWQVQSTASVGILPTWVEAMAFAWLARQSVLMQTGNLPAVTGAQKDVVLGVVCFA